MALRISCQAGGLPSRPDLPGLVECEEGALVQVDSAPLRSVQSTLHLDPAQMSEGSLAYP